MLPYRSLGTFHRSDSEQSQFTEADLCDFVSDTTSVLGEDLSYQEALLVGRTDDVLEMNDIRIVQGSWMEIKSLRLELSLLSDVFRWLRDHHSDMLPLWPFARHQKFLEFLEKDDFREYVGEMAASITKIIEGIPSKRTQSYITNLGRRHLYYNAAEPHFDAVKYGFMQIIRQYGKEDRISWFVETDAAWQHFSTWLMQELQTAIKEERLSYMARCLSEKEVSTIIEIWTAMKNLGSEDIGKIICQKTMRRYIELNPVTTNKATMNEETLAKMSNDTITAFDLMIDALPNDIHSIPRQIRPYVNQYRISGIVPFYAKMALKDAFICLVKEAIGRKAKESMIRTWSKLVEVFVQACIQCLLPDETAE